MKSLIKWFLDKIKSYKKKREFKKRMEEFKKQDPFTYNH